MDTYPLQTQKQKDYLLFKEAIQLYINNKHLSENGLSQIINIKASFNRGLSPQLKLIFPNYKPI